MIDMGTDNIERIELRIEQFARGLLVAALEGIQPNNWRVQYRYLIDRLAHSFTAVLTAPTAELRNSPVCDYPISLWDHIKAALGLKHKRRYWSYKELAVYPDIAVPPHSTTGMRIYRHAWSEDATT